jgi:ubiquitin-conjugating enzyme E2 J2
MAGMIDDFIKEKRMKNELRLLLKLNLGFAQIIPSEDDKLIFYFLLKGSDDSPYKGGFYIGKIMLDKDYPAKPGDFMMFTPSGRFAINSKICLSNSAYHSNEHTPSWTLENMVVGMASIFHEEDCDDKGRQKHSISHLYDPPQLRKTYASQSVDYNLKNYKNIFMRFKQFVDADGKIKDLSLKTPLVSTEENKPKKKNIEETKSDVSYIVDEIGSIQQTLMTKVPEIMVEIVKDNTIDEIIKDNTVDEIIKNNTVDEIIKNNTVDEIVKNNTVDEIVKDNTKEVKKKEGIVKSVKSVISAITNVTKKIPKEKKVAKNNQIYNKTLEPEERSEKIRTYIEQIKTMSYENFDIRPFEEINSLISPINIADL